MVSKSHLDPATNTAQAVSPPSLGKLEQGVPGTGPEMAVPWEGPREWESSAGLNPAKAWELGQSRALGEQWCGWEMHAVPRLGFCCVSFFPCVSAWVVPSLSVLAGAVHV